ncbi:toprim domain-containing protein [Phenylobacterium sp.]|uniref:DUF7146 domain-containing protein n=1 Tax=Phenylobacterium sp. TaxID=1871053 RepID=UPI0035B24A6F
MAQDASELARRLARDAEAVCRRYLSNGRREGAYWLVGDLSNRPGRSLYVRLSAPGDGEGVGKWTDAATGEHGDLLDLIALRQNLPRLRDTLDEARRFLALPPMVEPSPVPSARQASRGSAEAARRLFAMARPFRGTLAETYLRRRGLSDLADCAALRFHPHCYYRAGPDDRPDTPSAAPALLCAVTDLSGRQTGVLRTWLDPASADKAELASPRRAMGELRGYGIRFGSATSVLAAGEGVETLLALRQAAPRLPMVAAGSAAHLAALILPSGLRRLYLVRDNDPAGHQAVARLARRAQGQCVETMVLAPSLGDFNDDLRRFGRRTLADRVRSQTAPEDRWRLLQT